MINGVTGNSKQPAVAGNFKGTVIVMGTSRNIWEDIHSLKNVPADFMAINEIGLHFPGNLTHWSSLHHTDFQYWIPLRNQGSYIHTHCQQPGEGIATAWQISNEMMGLGTSGLWSCFVALALGYERVILAGIPMDNTLRYYQPDWYLQEKHEKLDRNDLHGAWERARDQVFNGKVRSMSGNTMSILGGPDGITG